MRLFKIQFINCDWIVAYNIVEWILKTYSVNFYDLLSSDFDSCVA